MAQHYSDPKAASDPYTLPDIETFHVPEDVSFTEMAGMRDCAGDDYDVEPGWYWWSCFPGCLPDGMPIGPFATEDDAVNDARDGIADYDDDKEGVE